MLEITSNQELWKDSGSLPTSTPYPALTLMNPVGSTKEGEHLY